MTTGHDAAMSEVGKVVVFLDVIAQGFSCPLLHCKPLHSAVASNSPLILLLFHGQDLERLSSGESLLHPDQLGDRGCRTRFRNGFVTDMGIALGSLASPRNVEFTKAFLLAWACGGLRLVSCFMVVGIQEAEVRRC